MKREFLMLAQNYDSKKHWIKGWYASEKLDGVRCFWDGGVSRGRRADMIPWANITKDGRLQHQPVATGLWTRYGKVIHAPNWWIDRLPAIPLDGELWMGRGSFQDTTSVVKRHIANVDDAGWRDVKYMVFDSTSLQVIFMDGVIDATHYKKVFRKIEVPHLIAPKPFGVMYDYLRGKLHEIPGVEMIQQKVILDYNDVEKMMNEICDAGGEGIMLRRPDSYWYPERSHNLLKIKPWHDDDAKVIGYTWGQGKYAGLMGSMICEYQGRQFELSGFTDDERKLWIINGEDAYALGLMTPDGSTVPPNVASRQFPRGVSVTFRYRELTVDGIPKEARYHRKGVDL